MNKFLHFLAHLFGWNYGMAVSKYDDKGRLWHGFECSTCGKIECKHMSNDIFCPVCGYYCSGKGGIGCIDKPSMQ